MLLNDILLHNLNSLKILLVDALGPSIVEGLHKMVKILHDLMLMKVTYRHRRSYSVWEIAAVMAAGHVVSLYSWRATQKIRARFRRTKNIQQKKLNAKEVLQATAVTMNGRQNVVAVVERIVNNYSLNISTQSPEMAAFETQHQFPTVEALAKFLEEKTILRLADFKSV